MTPHTMHTPTTTELVFNAAQAAQSCTDDLTAAHGQADRVAALHLADLLDEAARLRDRISHLYQALDTQQRERASG